MLKTCSKCGVEKDIKEFPPSKQTKDGYYPYCKICNANRVREYYKLYPERKRESDKRYTKQHPEKRREISQRYYYKHHNDEINRSRKYRKLNPEKRKEICQRYYYTSQEKMKEIRRRYYRSNIDKIRLKKREAIDKLHNWYIKQCIKGNSDLNNKDILPSMVDLYKAMILMHREVKKIKQGETT